MVKGVGQQKQQHFQDKAFFSHPMDMLPNPNVVTPGDRKAIYHRLATYIEAFEAIPTVVEQSFPHGFQAVQAAMESRFIKPPQTVMSLSILHGGSLVTLTEADS